jgi:hypothetical protein
MTAYNPLSLNFHVDRGRQLISAIESVRALSPETLDQAISLLIACIAAEYDTVEDIYFILELQASPYDEAVYEWLLEKFEGGDPANDLWTRDGNGRFKLLDPALAA